MRNYNNGSIHEADTVLQRRTILINALRVLMCSCRTLLKYFSQVGGVLSKSVPKVRPPSWGRQMPEFNERCQSCGGAVLVSWCLILARGLSDN